jgi:gluconate 2-dehydrogenase gamma chain
MKADNQITRREALKQVAILLGGAISAPTLAGALDANTRRAWASAQGWAPRTLSASQLELVAVMADHIIPETDTPGARAAGVHRFVDTLLTDHYPATERDRFLAGLADVDARAQSRQGRSFVACAAAEQIALLTQMDEEAYPAAGAAGAATGATGAGGAAAHEGWFFRRMKELTLVGYYTSEIGASRELRVSPFGTYRGDIPYTSVGRAWS